VQRSNVLPPSVNCYPSEKHKGYQGELTTDPNAPEDSSEEAVEALEA